MPKVNGALGPLGFAAAILASATMSVVAQPPMDSAPLGFIALVPWLILARTALRGALGGLVLGTLTGLGVGSWVPEALQSSGFTDGSSAAIWMFTCAGVRGMPMALLGLAAGWTFRARAATRLLACSGALFAAEWATSASLMGGPWALLGHSQWSNLPVAQLASVGGVPLVSALLVATNLAVAEIARPGAPSGSGRFEPLVCLIGILGALLIVGLGVAAPTSGGASKSPALDVVGVQLVTPRGEKWVPDLQWGQLQNAFAAARKALAGRKTPPDLLVFPETMVTIALEESPAIRGALVEFAREVEAPLLVGVVRRAAGASTRRYRNSVILVTPDGRVEDGPDKAVGVPFLEAEPSGPWLALAPLVGAATSGRRIETRSGPALQIGEFSVGVITCYEVLFPGLVAGRLAHAGVPLLYLADDSWSSGPSMARQALAAATFRAIENRSPVLRVAAGGVSAWIGPDGRHIVELGYRRHGHLEARLSPSRPSGPLDAPLLVAAPLLAGAFASGISRRNFRRPLVARLRPLLPLLAAVVLFWPSAARSEDSEAVQDTATQVTRLELDGLSYISLDGQTVAVPAGSFIGVRFGQPGPLGVSFTIQPGDVSIGPIDLPDGRVLRYGLASPASGLITRGKDSEPSVTLSASVRASLDTDGDTSEATFAVSLTTGTATATSADGTTRVEITGMKLVEGANSLQLVAGVTNGEKAAIAPGKPVTVVVSGSFDRPPILP